MPVPGAGAAPEEMVKQVMRRYNRINTVIDVVSKHV